MSTTVTAPLRQALVVRRKRRFRALAPYLFLLPAILLNVCIVSGPTIGTLAISLTNWDGLHAATFVGLNNYRALLQDTHFTFALANNFKWLLVYCTMPIVLGLLTAYIVRGLKRGQKVDLFLGRQCETVCALTYF